MRSILVACALLAALAGGSTAGAAGKGTTLSVVAYSTPKTVIGKIVEAWQATPQGKDVSFASRTAPRATRPRRSQPACAPTSSSSRPGSTWTLLVDAGLVDPRWDRQRTTGSRPTRSSSSRSGTATPSTSRAGTTWCGRASRWSRRTRSAPAPRSGTSSPPTARSAGSARRSAGVAYVEQLFQHVVSQDTSGRNATNTFLSGKGDVLLTYESEALELAAAGHDIRTSSPGRRC